MQRLANQIPALGRNMCIIFAEDLYKSERPRVSLNPVSFLARSHRTAG
jgi:hypothetical protein